MQKTEHRFTRRDVIRSIGVAAAGSLVLSPLAGLGMLRTREDEPERKRVLRLAHLTDIHVQPELNASLGMAAALRHVQSLTSPPELLLFGGDSIMDSFEANDARTQLQWDLFHSVLKAECSIPIRFCIGNHDVWGINRSKSKATGSEANYGKKRAVENFAISERFYSFDQAGWHFIVLDSTMPNGESYIARLDEEQFAWLEADLASVQPTTPILILSHIPLLSATTIANARVTDRERWELSGGRVHLDAPRFTQLFLKHRNVRLCLSGHMHLIERIDFNNVSFFCNGAVSGSWWKGKHHECAEGYAVLDLYDDGSYDHQYVLYGWKAP